MKKLLVLLLGVAMLTGIFAGCGKSSTLEVYTNAAFAPFEYMNGSEIVGVDVDIMNEVGKKLGKTIKFKNVDFDSIDVAVEQGKADVGAAGITITPERMERVAFSKPYYSSVQYVITKKTDTTDYSNLASFKGKKIGVQRGTTGNIIMQKWMEENSVSVTDNLKVFTDGETAALDLTTKNNIDVIVIDKLPAQIITSRYSDKLVCKEIVDESVETEEYGIIVQKGQDELLKAINEVIDELLANDVMETLVAYHEFMSKDIKDEE